MQMRSRHICSLMPFRFFFLLICLFCTGIAALGQAGRGGLSGLVTDASGAVIPGATVKLQNVGTGAARTTVSTSGGLYSFVSVAPGTYEVTTGAKGFQTQVQNHVTVTVDQVTPLNITLAIGSVSQVVTVNAAADLAETTNSTVGQLIDAATMDRVPLISRDVYELVQLSAGVIPANGTPNAADTPGIFNDRSGADVSSYTINGALQGTVYYMLDGSPIGIAENNLASLIPAFQIPEDAVDEYRVETQNAPATYQSGAAGVISLVSKSGTNKFHGDAFVYIRPDVLSANDYFYKQNELANGQSNTPADFHRYQEGGAIGGPLLHDKLFFFGDYEGTQQESLETGTFTVPTAAERTGDFSADALTIYNPLVADNVDGTRQAFSGNKIPVGDLDPVALNFAKQFPLPNTAGSGGSYHPNNYFASGSDPNNAQKFDVRLDYDLSENQRIFGRFSFARLYFGSAPLFGASNIFDPNYYRNTTNSRNILVGDDYNINSTSVLQTRFSFTRHYEDQVDPGQVPYDMTQLGFPASLAAQSTYPTIPFVDFGGFTSAIGGGTGGGWDFNFASENIDGVANYTTVLGKHAISTGLEYQKMLLNDGMPASPAGTYGFDDSATSSTTTAGDGSDFASFLLGMGQAPGNEGENFTKDFEGAEASAYYGAFLQDNYHVLKNLTVTLGLRWDIFRGRTERHDRLEYFNPDIQYSASGVAMTGGEVFAGVNSSRSPFLTNMKDFGPRAAVAWQPQDHLVLRAGAGIYYGPSTHMVAGPFFNSNGFFTSTNWNATTYNADGNTVLVNPLSNPFPNGVVEPSGSSLGAATGIGSTLNSELHSQPEPTVYNYNLGFEYQFPDSIVLSMGYVGSRGLHLPMNGIDLDQLSLGTIGKYGDGLLNNSVPNTWEPALPPTSAYYGQATVPQYMAVTPYPQYSNGLNSGVGVNGYPAGDSNYNSLQAKVEKRLTAHFTTLATYTWGKIMTDDANPPLSFIGYHGVGAPQDWRDLNLEHSVSPQDVTNQFSWQLSYDLPMGKGRALNLNGWANAVVGGWTVNSIVYLSSGLPINVPTGTGSLLFSQRVDMTCDPAKSAPHTADMWFNYGCFAEPASDAVAGKSPAFLSSVRTNGGHDWDLSLYKSFTMGGERNLRFEVSTYNLTNSVQLGYPNVFWNPSPTPDNMAGFGQITGDVNTPREFQVASRFTF
jgi:hypothetical protein